ncbi:MAG: Rne/Rng family ribonuclease [Planctomycetes bacterium]|nr:Rne/Rng family ribonuclease [Planctomycetota bacterium]
MARKIYMNVAEGDECRIAVLEDGKLYEFFIDRPSQLKHVGNIYKGIINNIEPGIQAAFVDIGLERNGFLHGSDVSYAYQNNPELTELYPKTLRIKETSPEDTLLHERKEHDVEEVDDYVGDGTHAHEATNGAVEAEFLDKLDEEHPGHPVTDSPLAVAPPEKEAPLAEAKPPAEAKPTADATPTAEPLPEKAPTADAPTGDKKKRRRRGRRGGRKHRERETSKEGATRPDNQEPVAAGAATATPAKTEAPAQDSPAQPEVQPPAAPDAATTSQKSDDAAAPKAETAKPKRRRTPKRRGGRLPRRVTGEVDASKPAPADGKAEAPKSAEPPRDFNDEPKKSGDSGPLEGPNYRYHRGPQPKIQNLLKRNQEVVIQVTKASQGGKGPGLSTFVSLPGRYMVLTPNSNRGGVSRKIEDGGARSDLRKMLDRLPVPEGMGVIVRTAAINRSFEDLQRDLNYLVRVWSVISERIHDSEAPALLYTDSDPAIRTVRDYFTADTTEIVVDNKEVFDRVLAFFDQLMPSFRDRVKLYQDDVPLFFSVGLENQLEHLFDKKVNLKSGGYLFVEQTEALISIDVNSGKFTSAGDAEKTAYQTNLEAIPEICRQLRLRDLGGIVCCDLIDMSTAKHRGDIENALRRELRKDRARTKVARMSPFGVIEMTRQRVRPSIKNYTYVSCPTCAGFGMVRSAETMCLSLIRRMKVALMEDRVHELAVQIHPHVLSHLHSEFRDDINDLEDHHNKRIVFEYAKDLILGQTRFFYMNDRGTRVLYDMDQRINSFVQSGPKAKTNVPVPIGATGAASPAAAQAQHEGKGRKRRRGGRKQRERDQERMNREARIKSDAGKAVTFGDKLPEPKVEIVKEDPKPNAPAKDSAGRRRGRRGGRKVRERETMSPKPGAGEGTAADTTRKSSGRKKTTDATGTAKKSPAKVAAVKASPKKAAPRKTATKTAAKKTTANKSAAKATTRKPAAKKTPAAKTAAKKPAVRKTAATKTGVKKAAAKKPATKKPAAKKPAAKKSAAKKTAKKPAKKKPTAK